MLKLICIDNNQKDLEETINQLICANEVESVKGFSKPAKALEYLREQNIQVAIIETSYPDLSGIELSLKINKISPTTDIIFLTSDPSYSLKAWDTPACGYIIKPIDPEKFEKTIERTYKHSPSQNERIYFRCFGNFECFFKRQPVFFERRQCKEFLAYLINKKGAEVSENEIRTILWEDGEDTPARRSYLRTLSGLIRKVFTDLGQPDVFRDSHGFFSMNTELVDCDYYDYLSGRASRDIFLGEYMSQYSWAEETAGAITFGFRDN